MPPPRRTANANRSPPFILCVAAETELEDRERKHGLPRSTHNGCTVRRRGSTPLRRSGRSPNRAKKSAREARLALPASRRFASLPNPIFRAVSATQDLPEYRPLEDKLFNHSRLLLLREYDSLNAENRISGRPDHAHRKHAVAQLLAQLVRAVFFCAAGELHSKQLTRLSSVR
jgi:hypothetical protein